MRYVSIQSETTNYTATEVKDTAAIGVKHLTRSHAYITNVA